MAGELGFTAYQAGDYRFCFSQTIKVYSGFRPPAKLLLQVRSKKPILSGSITTDAGNFSSFVLLTKQMWKKTS